MSHLTGKVALVTGGSRGIGAAVAYRLAQEGADVAITYVHSGEQAQQVVTKIEATGRRGMAVQADAADPQAVVAAVDRVAAELGRLDVLVNNAGIGVIGPLEDLSLDQVDQALAVNVRGVFLASQAAARHLGDGGRIISIGSGLSAHVPGPGMSVYAMSKSALVGLTKGLARDLGGRGITVNALHCGAVDTDMNPSDGPFAEGQRALTAVGRFGSPDEIAGMVAYLAGDEAGYVTGAALAIDGGHAA
ncbi:SDR family NAD(P)-dependent oxidoreductase [Actinoallomurus soli]|uniref:SDR family NAD(P)-dependent oxidoreductase n=1 Tax=Actinoallomurus soli TaxID=2952535 RepID=UPI002093B50D|nr:3-oxoacyl-ACP reductase family protein [Actinoallomurus soli]MCO5968612.1 3-oxoacyl-ACP reductase FabG [Actinoallomurus soli]